MQFGAFDQFVEGLDYVEERVFPSPFFTNSVFALTFSTSALIPFQMYKE